MRPTTRKIRPATVKMRPTTRKIRAATVKMRPTTHKIRATTVKMRPVTPKIRTATVPLRLRSAQTRRGNAWHTSSYSCAACRNALASTTAPPCEGPSYGQAVCGANPIWLLT